MNQAEILQAFQNAVKLAVAASGTPSLPIKFVDVVLQPQPDKYLEIVFNANDPPNTEWGDGRVRQGFFRLILHWPKNSQGPYSALTLIEQIGGYFTKDLLLGALKIADTPNCAGSIDGGADLLYPATVRYSSFTPA